MKKTLSVFLALLMAFAVCIPAFAVYPVYSYPIVCVRGAKSLPYGQSFSSEYVNKANADGDGAYISPDNIVDARTTLFPDTTWYIKNLAHSNFDGIQNEIVAKFFNEENFTIFSDENFPAFTTYTQDGKLAATEAVKAETENAKTANALLDTFRKIINFFKQMFAIIKRLIIK